MSNSIVDTLKNAVLGHSGGMTKQDARSLVQRNRFSDFLPWVTCDNGAFQSTDDRVGYIWEVSPYTFLGNDSFQSLRGLFNISLPTRSIIQAILFTDHNVDAVLDRYVALKTRDEPLAQFSVRQYANHLRRGTRGMKQFQDIPVRNFRSLICLKPSEPISDQDLSIFEETLKGAKLFPTRWGGNDVVAWGRQFFNDPFAPPNPTHDPSIPLRKQIINAETSLDFTDGLFRIGNRYGTVLTPKVCPKNMDALIANRMVGGFRGITDDGNQITSPFIYSLNIVLDDLKGTIGNKASATMAQKAGGSFAKAIQRRTDEFEWALDQIADGKKFVSIIPSLMILDESKEKCLDNTSRARRVWENFDFIMQQETILNKAMFISSLPLGLYDIDHNLTVMDRHFYVPTDTATVMMPVQGDFAGSSEPVLAFVGRKGQIITLDMFDPRATAYNSMIVAGTGSGKSYTMSQILSSYYASGAKIRLMDIGYSYQKLCSQCKRGRYLDYGKDKIVANPLHSNAKDEEDRAVDAMAAANVIAEMVYSASRAQMTETEWTLLKEAVRWTIENGEEIYGIDAVIRYLKEYPKLAKEPPSFADAIDSAHKMAFNLYDFGSNGPYGKFFNGPNNFDIKEDDFVVVELDKLTGRKELLNVVVTQMLNSITQDLYLSDRKDKRFIIFEETAQYFTEESDSRVAVGIELAYRRARKYSGSCGVVLQSPLDIAKFGAIGRVIKANAMFKFLLMSEDYGAAADQKILDYSGLALDLLKEVKTNRPKYSEIFFETPMGRGVGRLAVDPWTHWINTTAPDDVSKYNTLIEAGKSPMEAISILSGVPLT